jgi:hypothetical protein
LADGADEVLEAIYSRQLDQQARVELALAAINTP